MILYMVRFLTAISATIGSKFNFVVMGFILHHLIGQTREESRLYAKQAISHASKLLKDGGYLFICALAYYSILFDGDRISHKKFIARMTSKRIYLFRKWAHIGMLVVSFYTNEQLIEMIDETPNVELVEQNIEPSAFIIRRIKTTLVIRRSKH